MGEATDVLRRDFAAACAQDPDGIRAAFAPDCRKWVPGAYLEGSEAVVQWDSVLWEAFPDMDAVLVDVVEEGTRVGFSARVTATHHGTLRTDQGDIPATGRRIDFDAAGTCEVRDGRITTMHMLFDRLTILEQLGVAAVPASV